MVGHAHACGPSHAHVWPSPTLGPSPAGLGPENPYPCTALRPASLLPGKESTLIL